MNIFQEYLKLINDAKNGFDNRNFGEIRNHFINLCFGPNLVPRILISNCGVQFFLWNNILMKKGKKISGMWSKDDKYGCNSQTKSKVVLD